MTITTHTQTSLTVALADGRVVTVSEGKPIEVLGHLTQTVAQVVSEDTVIPEVAPAKKAKKKKI